jgi:hypothetical protein
VAVEEEEEEPQPVNFEVEYVTKDEVGLLVLLEKLITAERVGS